MSRPPMPLAICRIARVMMKEGTPIQVIPMALATPRLTQTSSATTIASPPERGMLAMFTLAFCAVKNATAMPVALATLATLRSISAHRITKVRPTAMIPVTETSVRILVRVSSEAKLGLAIAKKINNVSRVANGAKLATLPLNELRTLRSSPAATRFSESTVITVTSRRSKKLVFTQWFASKFARDSALFHHNHAVGESQDCFWFCGSHDDRNSLFSQIAHDFDDVLLGADVHPACRLAQN